MDHRHHAMVEPGEDDEELALVELKRSDRWAGYSETHPGVQVLDILQESTTILRKHDGMLLTLAFLLAIPVSTLLLSHVLLRLPILERMVDSLQLAAQERLGRQFHPEAYRRLAETVTSRLLDAPIFSPLLKASVSYVVASTYARRKLKLTEALNFVHKSSLLQTFLWTCALYLAFASAGLGFASSVVGVALAAGMAMANVTCNLAFVVSALEGVSGRHALVQSAGLLKGRLEVALLLFLVTNVNGCLLDILFEFRVLRNNDATIVYDKYWEAPLLVCMHSFVHLFDAIMVSVFYFICKSSSMTPELQHLSSAKDLQHLSSAKNLQHLSSAKNLQHLSSAKDLLAEV